MMIEEKLRNFHNKFMHYRSRPESSLTASFDNTTAMNKAREIQAERFSDLNMTDKKQAQSFASYTCMASFAEDAGCRSMLEIGAGLSTAVWAEFAERTGAEISTVDASFSNLEAFLKGTSHEATIAQHVNLVQGTTNHSNELIEFYLGEPHSTYGGVEISSFLDQIDLFQSRFCSSGRWQLVSDIAGQWNWSAREMMTQDGKLLIPRPLLDMFSSDRNFDNEISFLKGVESKGQGGVIEKLIADGTCWDMIFFDSGEFASMLEWTRLKSRINVGGHAAFHDVFFPKSIKNLIPCAAILTDPDWEMVFCDDSTKQGIMIAKRLR
jgi:hypothetical protein